MLQRIQIRLIHQFQLSSASVNLNLKFTDCQHLQLHQQQKLRFEVQRINKFHCSLSPAKPHKISMSHSHSNSEGSKTPSPANANTPSSTGSGAAGSLVDVNRSRCIFCKICDKKDQESIDKILFENDEFVVFPDIKPATKHHLLIVTKEHIRDAKSLDYNHLEFLDRMIQTGHQALKADVRKHSGITPNLEIPLNDEKILMGFHWPPFHTISHLHLHVIYPSDSMGFFGRLIFRPNSYWFVQPEWVKERLEKMKK